MTLLDFLAPKTDTHKNLRTSHMVAEQMPCSHDGALSDMASAEDFVQALTDAMTTRAHLKFDQQSLGRPEISIGMDTDWPTWSFVVRPCSDSISLIIADRLAAARIDD